MLGVHHCTSFYSKKPLPSLPLTCCMSIIGSLPLAQCNVARKTISVQALWTSFGPTPASVIARVCSQTNPVVGDMHGW